MGRYGLPPSSTASLSRTDSRINKPHRPSIARERKVQNLRALKAKCPQADVISAKVTVPTVKVPKVKKAKPAKANDADATKKAVDVGIDAEIEGVRAKLQAMPTPMPPGAWPKEREETRPVSRTPRRKTAIASKGNQTPSPLKLTPRLPGPPKIHCTTPPPGNAMFTFNKTAPYSWNAEDGFQYQHENEEPPSPTRERSKSPLKWIAPDPPASPKKKRFASSPEGRWFAPTKLDLKNLDPDASPRHQVKIPKPPKVDVRRAVKVPAPVSPTPAARRRAVESPREDVDPKAVPFRLPKLPNEPPPERKVLPGRLALRRDKERWERANDLRPASPVNPRFRPYPTRRPSDVPVPSLPERALTPRPMCDIRPQPKLIRKCTPAANKKSGSPFKFDFIYSLFSPSRPPVPCGPGALTTRSKATCPEIDASIVQAFNRYTERWDALKVPHFAWPVKLQTIPWPLEKFNPTIPAVIMFSCPTASELSTEAVGEFLLSRMHSPGVPRRKRIQNALRLYHPDKFDAVIERIMDKREQEVAKRTADTVVKVLNRLLEEEVF